MRGNTCHKDSKLIQNNELRQLRKLPAVYSALSDNIQDSIYSMLLRKSVCGPHETCLS